MKCLQTKCWCRGCDDKGVNTVVFYDQTQAGVEWEWVRSVRSWEIVLVVEFFVEFVVEFVEYTFLINDKGVNFVAFYDQTMFGVEFSVRNTPALIGENFAKKTSLALGALYRIRIASAGGEGEKNKQSVHFIQEYCSV